MDFFYLISILFAGCSVVFSWDSNSVDYEKRQLVPLPRIGRSYMEAKRQGLIPSPRVGRSSSSSSYNGIEKEYTLNADKYNEIKKYTISNPHEVHVIEGIPLLKLSPFAGRRKRSSPVAEDSTNDISIDDLELTKTLRSNTWDLDDNQDFFQRNARQLIPAPRVGRSDNTYKTQLISGIYNGDDDDMVDPIDLQLRAAFIPRLGKRANSQNFDQYSDLEDVYKRAAAFTPRIGRAAFTPRIGKKAAFVPRIGRSTDKMSKHSI